MVKEIQLTQGKVTIVDDEDYNLLMQYKWNAVRWNKIYYASHTTRRINGKQTHIKMHRLLIDAKKGEIVDHINGDGLDNRKCNLRIVNNAQNIRNSRINRSNNTSGYKGVSYRKRSDMYEVSIQTNAKTIYLGLFKSKIEAALVYDQKAMELFDEFAILNFPDYI